VKIIYLQKTFNLNITHKNTIRITKNVYNIFEELMTIIKIGKSNTYKLFCHCNICLFHDKMSQRKDTKDATAKRSCQNLEIEILETDWKNKNLYMHKGLQFKKLIEEKFKQYNNEERKK